MSLLSEGRTLAIQGSYPEAIEFLQFAQEKAPEDPRPLYLLAFCQASLNENSAAAVSMAAACSLERRGTKFNWPQYMERIQGPKRIWVEVERRRQLNTKTGR